MIKSKKDKSNVEVRKSKDVLAYFWEDALKSKKRYWYIIIGQLFVNVVSLLMVVYFVYLKKADVVVIDATGKPHLTKTVEEENMMVFKEELQRFFMEIVIMVYERNYVDFLDQEKVAKIVEKLRLYFLSEKMFNDFFRAYLQSPFVHSLRSEKYVMKVGELSAVDVKIDSETGMYKAIGKFKTTAYLSGGETKTQYKIVEISFKRGKRTMQNPFGFYIKDFVERGIEDAQ